MKKTLEVINWLKEKGLLIDYAIGGAIGVLKWVEPFFTRDLDIFVITSGEMRKGGLIVLTPIYDFLKKKGYDEWIGQWIIIDGVPVEFIPAEGLARESVENAVETDFEGVKTRIITPEYLIALLSTAGREKDRIKIEMLLKQAEIDMLKLRNILIKYNLHKEYRFFIKESKDE